MAPHNGVRRKHEGKTIPRYANWRTCQVPEYATRAILLMGHAHYSAIGKANVSSYLVTFAHLLRMPRARESQRFSRIGNE
jgi:hypothetical protein